MVDLPAEACCRGCGYSLRRLEVARCPECGRAFDPDDPTTFWTPTGLSALMRRSARTLVRWAFRTPLNATGRAAAGWLLCGGLMFSLWQVSIPLGILGTAVALGVTTLTLCELMVARGRRRGLGRAIAVAVAATVALNVGFDRCPHATYVTFGPVCFTVSGRRCGNERHPVAILNVLTGIPNPWMTPF